MHMNLWHSETEQWRNYPSLWTQITKQRCPYRVFVGTGEERAFQQAQVRLPLY